METVIVICLLLIIYLLAKDQFISKKRPDKKKNRKKKHPQLPHIMGQPKPMERLPVQDSANESQTAEAEINQDNLDIEYDENEILSIEASQEKKIKEFKNTPDWEAEEEEWIRYGIASGDNGFAQGVTFEELSSVGMLLQEERLEPSQKETAIAVVQKIQGTELFNLLENSMESASRKIAELLDGSLSSETDSIIPILRKNDLENFNIEEFV